MTTQEVTKVLLMLQAVWPERAIEKDTISAYKRAFAGVPFQDMQTAADEWLQTGKYFPRPVELLGIVDQLIPAREVLNPGTKSTAEQRTQRFHQTLNRARAELDAKYPPDQFPFDGMLRTLYATGRMTPEQRRTAESRLTPEQRRHYAGAFGSRRDDLPLSGKGGV